eukprot:c38139_g1_i1 orf=181-513(+)
MRGLPLDFILYWLTTLVRGGRRFHFGYSTRANSSIFLHNSQAQGSCGEIMLLLIHLADILSARWERFVIPRLPTREGEQYSLHLTSGQDLVQGSTPQSKFLQCVLKTFRS